VTVRSLLLRLVMQEDLNFLLTNRIPRRLLTRFMGWFSEIEHPLVRDASLAIWRYFGKLDLTDAKKTHFRSMQDCFVRELREGARPVHPAPDVLVSPCDAIVGASGRVEATRLIQAKGFPYSLDDLLGDTSLVHRFRNGRYVTLRLTSGMYHRFHAPYDCRVRRVTYISGDTWNVNPIALARVERLFCRNERAVIEAEIEDTPYGIALVPVAAVLVASIRLRFLDVPKRLDRRGANHFACDARLRKGEEMGWFQQGSTIIVFAPPNFTLCTGVAEGNPIRMGEPLMRTP
jgi:phosphatidylserine decarboxylase